MITFNCQVDSDIYKPIGELRWENFVEKMYMISSDGGNHAATISIGANLHIWKMCIITRVWGAESPSRLPGKQNHKVSFELLGRILLLSGIGYVLNIITSNNEKITLKK